MPNPTPWNRTAKIKAIILLLVALPNLIRPVGAAATLEATSILFPLVFGIIVVPLISRFRKAFLGAQLEKPAWNDNPLTFKRPLSFFHFGAWFFIVVGMSMLLGTAMKYQTLNPFGLTTICFGAGILAGIYFTLMMVKEKPVQES